MSEENNTVVRPSGSDSKIKSNESVDDVHFSTALNLAWSFGINKHVPVLNLSTDTRKGLFYTTAHTGVHYNFKKNTQILYQGHCNAISYTCVSMDKRWLATADIGDDCMLIVWDTETSVPIRTIFDIDQVGVIAMAFSADAKYVAVLSCAVPQVLTIWDWTVESEDPCVHINLDEGFGLQTYISFNVNNVNQLVSNNGKQVMFYKWSLEDDILVNAPSLSDEDFNKTVGIYNQSIFHPYTSCAFTSTSCGNIVVWTINDSLKNMEAKALKIVKIQEKAITVLCLLDNIVVTGDVLGTVKFFDLDLRLINWFNKFGSQGSINSISFSYASIIHEEENYEPKGPISATLESKPFITNDFSISTNRATMLYFDSKNSDVKYIQRHNDKDIKAIACHPKDPYLAIGGFDALLQIIDFETKILKNSKQFPEKLQITSLIFNDTGDYLAVGFSNGQVQILDSLTMELDNDAGDTQSSFHHSRGCIVKLVFSNDSSLLACYDTDRCVIVFKFNTDDKTWQYVGKNRAHYKQITDLMFIKALDVESSRLMSIGQDRMLVEYDMKNSSVDDLRVLSTDRIEQDAVPICFVAYPPVVKEDFIAVVNNQYKIKLFNSTTKMCRHTFLGPTYGSPVKQLVTLPESPNSSSRYVAYITKEKVGLIILPLDGNPHNSMALIAHPGGVHNAVCSSNGQYLFTSGGEDKSVLMWKVDTNSLQASAGLGGDGLLPFYSLLEGGRDGPLFAELETYFYHAQIRNQGVDAMESRTVSTQIPLSEIPFIMRALGYYPTEQEIDEILNEVKFSTYVGRGKCLETIDIGGLLKLYVNHRPAFGVNPDELINSFRKLGSVDYVENQLKLDRFELLSLLQEKGEHITEEELADCITMLVEGGDSDGIVSEENSTAPLDEILPEQISLDYFANELLGFGTKQVTTNG